MSELLTLAQVAAILKVSEETVARKFQNVKGVIDLGSPETTKRRRYRVLRIPKTVVERFLVNRGGGLHFEPPPVKSRTRKKTVSPDEDEIIRELAKAVSQHGEAAQLTLDKIAKRARALTFVPEEDWGRVVWVDDDDNL